MAVSRSRRSGTLLVAVPWALAAVVATGYMAMHYVNPGRSPLHLDTKARNTAAKAEATLQTQRGVPPMILPDATERAMSGVLGGALLGAMMASLVAFGSWMGTAEVRTAYPEEGAQNQATYRMVPLVSREGLSSAREQAGQHAVEGAIGLARGAESAVRDFNGAVREVKGQAASFNAQMARMPALAEESSHRLSDVVNGANLQLTKACEDAGKSAETLQVSMTTSVNELKRTAPVAIQAEAKELRSAGISAQDNAGKVADRFARGISAQTSRIARSAEKALSDGTHQAGNQIIRAGDNAGALLQKSLRDGSRSTAAALVSAPTTIHDAALGFSDGVHDAVFNTYPRHLTEASKHLAKEAAKAEVAMQKMSADVTADFDRFMLGQDPIVRGQLDNAAGVMKAATNAAEKMSADLTADFDRFMLGQDPIVRDQLKTAGLVAAPAAALAVASATQPRTQRIRGTDAITLREKDELRRFLLNPSI